MVAATAGSLVVASAIAPAPPAEAAARVEAAFPVLERAEELRSRMKSPAAERRESEPATRLAWWGNWHNWGYHPWWHNWPNWRNWHNWGNW